MANLLFENTACARCGGSGNYSFNMVNGTRCFGCGGSGHKLTKRGKAAQQFLNALRCKPASEVKIGDLVHFDMHFFACFSRVTEISADSNGGIKLNAIRKKTGETLGMTIGQSTLVRMGFTEEEKISQREQALAYQATLTQAGTPGKRKVKAES